MNDPRPARGHGGFLSTGPIAVATATIATVALWYLLRPAGFAQGRYAGEVAGVVAVELLTVALVLATRWRLVEHAFGGLDRVYVWHRWVAAAGVLLFVPHIALVGGAALPTPDSASPAFAPRYGLGHDLAIAATVGLALLGAVSFLPQVPVVRNIVRLAYERWLASHRFIGLFVVAAVAHGLLVDPVIRASAALCWFYFAIGCVAVSAIVARQVANLRGGG